MVNEFDAVFASFAMAALSTDASAAAYIAAEIIAQTVPIVVMVVLLVCIPAIDVPIDARNAATHNQNFLEVNFFLKSIIISFSICVNRLLVFLQIFVFCLPIVESETC